MITRRQFIQGTAAVGVALVTPLLSDSVEVRWVERSFDFGHQYGFAVEVRTNDQVFRNASRIRTKFSELPTDEQEELRALAKTNLREWAWCRYGVVI